MLFKNAEHNSPQCSCEVRVEGVVNKSANQTALSYTYVLKRGDKAFSQNNMKLRPPSPTSSSVDFRTTYP